MGSFVSLKMTTCQTVTPLNSKLILHHFHLHFGFIKFHKVAHFGDNQDDVGAGFVAFYVVPSGELDRRFEGAVVAFK
jgi:hypothetical protein